MEKEFKKKGIATFEGMSVGKNKVATLKFKLSSGDILTSVELLTGLNNDISVIAKLPGRKPATLGLFTIGSLNFDKDGNAGVQFKAMFDNICLENIQKVVESDEDSLQLMFKALLELPENEEDNEE